MTESDKETTDNLKKSQEPTGLWIERDYRLYHWDVTSSRIETRR